MEGKIDLLAEKWPQGKRLKYSVITEPHSYSISTDPSGGNLWAGFCQEIDLNIFTGSHQLHKVWKIEGFKSTGSYSREASTHNSPLNQPLMPMGSIWYPLNCKTSLYVTFLLPIFICKTPFLVQLKRILWRVQIPRFNFFDRADILSFDIGVSCMTSYSIVLKKDLGRHQ